MHDIDVCVSVNIDLWDNSSEMAHPINWKFRSLLEKAILQINI